MAGVKITGAEYPIRDIFSDAFLFEIPSYQRPYSWTTDQAEELITDVLAALRDSDPRDPDPYFLGSIVLAKDEGMPSAKVIDGQQRLTTVTVLLSVLANTLPEKEGEQLRIFIRQEANEFAGTEATPRLTLRSRDAAFFRKYVQEPDGITKLTALDPAQLENDAQRNVLANAGFFANRIVNLSEEEKRQLGRYLVASCYLVAVSTPDRDSAFRIFTILNGRGLDLSHADILKSELIGEIADSVREEVCTKLWEDAEAELGRAQFAELFSHIRMIYAKTKSRGSLLKEFRQYVTSTITNPESFIEDVVVPYADVYARIINEAWEATTHADDINNTLAWLNRIDNFDWIPPAIKYLNLHKNDPESIATFLEALERLAASMYIRRVGINGRIDRYADLLREIENGRDGTMSGGALELSPVEREETRARLAGQVYLDKTRLYILLRLDDALNGGGSKYEHKIISVEHVLPQSPAPDSTWMVDFTTAEREYWTHRLANLVLLPRRKNSAARNYDFEIKKQKYFTGRDGSPFILTTQVLAEGNWTPAILKLRQHALIQRLTDMWTL